MAVKNPTLVVAGATLCCAPMVPGLLAGEISGTVAAERFLVALVVCFILGSLLSWVIRTYNAQAQRAQLMRLLDDPKPTSEPITPASAE